MFFYTAFYQKIERINTFNNTLYTKTAEWTVSMLNNTQLDNLIQCIVLNYTVILLIGNNDSMKR